MSLCENLHPILIKSDDCKSASTSTHGPVKIHRPRHQKNISEVCKKGIQLESVSHVPKIGFNAAVFLDSKILESPQNCHGNSSLVTRYGSHKRHGSLEKSHRFKSQSVQKENVRQVIKKTRGLFQSIDDSNKVNQN